MRAAGRALPLLAAALPALSAGAGEPPPPAFAPDELRSGYEFARPETRAMQDDDFANPGLLWVEAGERLWAEPAGPERRACADCHADPSLLRDAAATHPKIDPASGRLVNLEQRINLCRGRRMGAPPLADESDDLLALSSYLARLAAGRPLRVRIDGEAAPWFERGRALYHERVGQMNLACAQCHDRRHGSRLRAEHVSQGHVNGFPAYLLRWGRPASVHRRFQFCNEQARAEPLAIGDDDYNALQLYVAWRGTGLPVEAPAVRR